MFFEIIFSGTNKGWSAGRFWEKSAENPWNWDDRETMVMLGTSNQTWEKTLTNLQQTQELIAFSWNNNCNQNYIGWSQFSINECQKHRHNTSFALYTCLILRAKHSLNMFIIDCVRLVYHWSTVVNCMEWLSWRLCVLVTREPVSSGQLIHKLAISYHIMPNFNVLPTLEGISLGWKPIQNFYQCFFHFCDIGWNIWTLDL